MSNPWKEIQLNDYENHMKLDSVFQFQTLNNIMKELLCAYDTKSVMILGVAGGNGLEHIGKDDFDVVYGVDINEKYLQTCEKGTQDCKEPLRLYVQICLEKMLRCPMQIC